jgi:hypothetical protein
MRNVSPVHHHSAKRYNHLFVLTVAIVLLLHPQEDSDEVYEVVKKGHRPPLTMPPLPAETTPALRQLVADCWQNSPRRRYVGNVSAMQAQLLSSAKVPPMCPMGQPVLISFPQTVI